MTTAANIDAATGTPKRDHFTAWVDKVFRTSYHPYAPGRHWQPPINIYEDQSHYYVIVDLAGI